MGSCQSTEAESGRVEMNKSAVKQTPIMPREGELNSETLNFCIQDLAYNKYFSKSHRPPSLTSYFSPLAFQLLQCIPRRAAKQPITLLAPILEMIIHWMNRSSPSGRSAL